MAEYITTCATLSDLTTWYTSTVPSSIPSGDRYIAELAANGDYPLAGVTWTGKTLVEAGQIVIRAAAAGKPNKTSNAARYYAPGVASSVLYHSFGAVNTFGSNVVDGFVLEDLNIASVQNGSFTFNGGCLVRKCVLTRNSLNGSLTVGQSGRAANCLFISTVANVAVVFTGSGSQDSNTFVSFIDYTALAFSGSYQNAVWKNNVALNLAASPTYDPWATPPTSFFGASSSNNATSHSSAGNCPGSSPLSAVSPSAALVNVAGSGTLDATPKAGSALLAAGVVSTPNGGVDWYGSTRSGSTPSIGAVESVPTAPSALSGNVTLDSVSPAGTLADAGATSLSGGVTLDAVAPAGTLGVAPGAYSIPALTNWSGSVQAAVTVPWVTFQRLADGVQVLVLADQVTDGSGNLSGTNAALLTGTTYMTCGWNADGSSRFARPVTAT